jgi:hypothetical protein
MDARALNRQNQLRNHTFPAYLNLGLLAQLSYTFAALTSNMSCLPYPTPLLFGSSYRTFARLSSQHT